MNSVIMVDATAFHIFISYKLTLSPTFDAISCLYVLPTWILELLGFTWRGWWRLIGKSNVGRAESNVEQIPVASLCSELMELTAPLSELIMLY